MAIDTKAAGARLALITLCGIASVSFAACETTEQESAAIGRANKLAFERAKRHEELERRRHQHRHDRRHKR
ncbi:MAG TPA: hypothetical protein VMA83_06075 [Solirubrobacteraceae bacterium]|nr:hypothetical protein [Solirubrobacteraceae bacterium]